ncbi:DUF3833 domain-containing protein [Thalassotalea piscium]
MSKLYEGLVLVITLFLFGCSTELEDYQKTDKPYDIQQYFNGNVIAWGIIQDYTNKVQRRFCVEIIGTWKDDKGTLAETFYFNDGEITYRNWQMTKQGDGSYTGHAEDVVGIAIGKHQGFAFQFTYQLMLSLDDKTYQVSMDDWMYQIDEHRVVNKTSMSKLGFKVADITLFFDKQLPTNTCSLSH